MKTRLSLSLALSCALITNALYATDYTKVSVHDPSIVRTADGMFYLIGSHMSGAKSPDLMRWTPLGRSVDNQSYFSNIKTQLSEALTWGETNTFWAADYVQLRNGKWLMYYCVCEGSKPQGLIGYAIANSPEGPFTDLGILRRSKGSAGLFDPGDGSSIFHNANNMPNCVDPTVFYDKENRLWMVYGSYSGGIFILELDPETGNILPKDQQPTDIKNAWPYGKRLTGGNHSPLEAAYIMYSPETDYYYLFISMGGLGQQDGYNIRVARSKTPHGRYLDEKGQDIAGANTSGTMYNYGLKVMGNHRFMSTEGEVNKSGISDANYSNYMSPGHNSAYYDSLSGRYFLVFHTRFNNRGEQHEVRVHPFELNANDWPIVAPLPYSGEVSPLIEREELAGTYQLLNLGTGVSKTVIQSQTIELLPGGAVTGALAGIWETHTSAPNAVTMRLDGKVYRGKFFYQYDERTATYKWTFALAGAATNSTLWGVKVQFADSSSGMPIELDADYVLVNARSGHVLQASDTEDGTATSQLYNTQKASVFRLHYNASSSAYQLQTKASGYTQALSFRRNSSTTGALIVTYPAADTLTDNRTLFLLSPTERGTYSLTKQGKPNIAIRVASNTLGSSIQAVATNPASEDQQWILIKQSHAPIPDAIETINDESDDARIAVNIDGHTLTAGYDQPATFLLYDLSSRLVGQAQGQEVQLQMPARGIYLLVVRTAKGTQIVRKVLF